MGKTFKAVVTDYIEDDLDWEAEQMEQFELLKAVWKRWTESDEGYNTAGYQSFADPDDFVFNNYACGMAINVQKSCTEAMDALLQKAKSATTQEARKAAYLEQQQLSLEEMPIVPLVNAWILTAYTDKLKGYKPMRTGFLKTLKDAWLSA